MTCKWAYRLLLIACSYNSNTLRDMGKSRLPV